MQVNRTVTQIVTPPAQKRQVQGGPLRIAMSDTAYLTRSSYDGIVEIIMLLRQKTGDLVMAMIV